MRLPHGDAPLLTCPPPPPPPAAGPRPPAAAAAHIRTHTHTELTAVLPTVCCHLTKQLTQQLEAAADAAQRQSSNRQAARSVAGAADAAEVDLSHTAAVSNQVLELCSRLASIVPATQEAQGWATNQPPRINKYDVLTIAGPLTAAVLRYCQHLHVHKRSRSAVLLLATALRVKLEALMAQVLKLFGDVFLNEGLAHCQQPSAMLSHAQIYVDMVAEAPELPWLCAVALATAAAARHSQLHGVSPVPLPGIGDATGSSNSAGTSGGATGRRSSSASSKKSGSSKARSSNSAVPAYHNALLEALDMTCAAGVELPMPDSFATVIALTSCFVFIGADVYLRTQTAEAEAQEEEAHRRAGVAMDAACAGSGDSRQSSSNNTTALPELQLTIPQLQLLQATLAELMALVPSLLGAQGFCYLMTSLHAGLFRSTVSAASHAGRAPSSTTALAHSPALPVSAPLDADMRSLLVRFIIPAVQHAAATDPGNSLLTAQQLEAQVDKACDIPLSMLADEVMGRKPGNAAGA